jgi:MSHA type pilus biogenesis protein MshL
LLAVAVLAVVPLAVGADQSSPLRPLAAVQIEGSAIRQVPPAQTPPTPPPSSAPLSPVPVTQIDDAQQHPELDRRFSLELSGPQSVRDLIELLVSEDTRLSLYIDPSIEAQFQGQLRDMTIREALDLIAEHAGLDYVIRGNVLRVFPRELETRLIPIDYVITARSGSRSLSASSGASGAGATSGAGGGTAVAGGASGGGATGSAGGGGSSAQVGGSDAPNFFEDLEAGVRALLSADGVLNLDRTAGLIQVTDRTSRLDRIEAYVATVMQRVTRQVMIEARVIEVELREQFKAGLNWNAIFRQAGNALTFGQTLSPADGVFTLSGTIDDNFEILASFFKEQGTVNVLSSPRVAAMNNQTALIQAGTQEVFFTSTTQRDPQGIIVQQTETPQTVTIGVVLSVTPQISSDGIIHLSMNPSITDSTGVAISPTGAQVPIVNTRATDTLARVRDGETIVLGGLMQDRSGVTTVKVPFLGDVPLLGHFFKRTEKNLTKTDLVIMLTPTLMSQPDVSAATAREIRRIDAAQRDLGKSR